jgi:hypothetical protein
MQAVKIKIGAGGISANKGSTSIRFNYADTSFMFLNCHLASGQKEVLDRFTGLAQCYSESIQAFNNTICGEKPEPPDHQVLSGDMNWRVELPYHEAIALANENKLEELH